MVVGVIEDEDERRDEAAKIIQRKWRETRKGVDVDKGATEDAAQAEQVMCASGGGLLHSLSCWIAVVVESIAATRRYSLIATMIWNPLALCCISHMRCDGEHRRNCAALGKSSCGALPATAWEGHQVGER